MQCAVCFVTCEVWCVVVSQCGAHWVTAWDLHPQLANQPNPQISNLRHSTRPHRGQLAPSHLVPIPSRKWEREKSGWGVWGRFVQSGRCWVVGPPCPTSHLGIRAQVARSLSRAARCASVQQVIPTQCQPLLLLVKTSNS